MSVNYEVKGQNLVGDVLIVSGINCLFLYCLFLFMYEWYCC